MRGQLENELRGSIFAHYFSRVRENMHFSYRPVASDRTPELTSAPGRKAPPLPHTGPPPRFLAVCSPRETILKGRPRLVRFIYLSIYLRGRVHVFAGSRGAN